MKFGQKGVSTTCHIPIGRDNLDMMKRHISRDTQAHAMHFGFDSAACGGLGLFFVLCYTTVLYYFEAE